MTKATHAAFHTRLARAAIGDARTYLTGDDAADRLAIEAIKLIDRLAEHIKNRTERAEAGL